MYSYHVNRIPCCLVKFSFRPIGYDEAQKMLRCSRLLPCLEESWAPNTCCCYRPVH